MPVRRYGTWSSPVGVAVASEGKWVVRPSGVIAPRPRERPVAIDLFCGVGGFSLGFIRAGFHVVAGLDNDPFAAITYMHNLGAYPCQFHFAAEEDSQRLEKAMRRGMEEAAKQHGGISPALLSGHGFRRHFPELPGVEHFFFGDARQFTGAQILEALGMERGEVDCVMGSPPCQGFSMAGKRNVLDRRNSLVFEFARLVCEISPKTMVFENVPGIASMVTPAGLPVLDVFCRILEDGGFGTVEALKRGLLQSSGAGAALRSTQTARSRRASSQLKLDL